MFGTGNDLVKGEPGHEPNGDEPDDQQRKREEHEADKWYYEPEDYVGFTIFSESHESREDAVRAAFECGEREETLKNEIGGG